MSENRGAPIVDAIASVSSDALIGFLQKQRWFAAKTSTPTGARFSNILVAPWGDAKFALTRIAVTAGDEEQCYQLPLALRATFRQARW